MSDTIYDDPCNFQIAPICWLACPEMTFDCFTSEAYNCVELYEINKFTKFKVCVWHYLL